MHVQQCLRCSARNPAKATMVEPRKESATLRVLEGQDNSNECSADSCRNYGRFQLGFLCSPETIDFSSFRTMQETLKTVPQAQRENIATSVHSNTNVQGDLENSACSNEVQYPKESQIRMVRSLNTE